MSDRREFLVRSAQLGALATVGNYAFLDNLPPLSAQEVRWVKRRDLPGLPFCEADVPVLVRLAEEDA